MNSSDQRISQLVTSRNRLLVALLLLLLLILCSAAYFAQSYANTTLQSILQGTIGSIVASIVFYLLFQQLVEPNIAEASMLAATEAATRLTLDHLQQVPTAVYAGGKASDPSFEAHLRALLNSSGPQGSYTFLGESALVASRRLQDPHWTPLLTSLGSVIFIVTDPTNAATLEIQARHRLERRQGNYDHEQIVRECNIIKYSVYKTIETLLPLLATERYDLTFLNGHTFFRAELLTEGVFLAYYDSTKTYTQTSYFPNTSNIYKAHQRNISNHLTWPDGKFHLKASSGQSLNDVLQVLGLERDLAGYLEWCREQLQ